MKLQAIRDINSRTRPSFKAGEVFEIDSEAGKAWVKSGLAKEYTPPAVKPRAGRKSPASRPVPASLPPIAPSFEGGETEPQAEPSSPSTSAFDSLHGLTFSTQPTSNGGDSTT
jgi:hypothetical protein